MLPRAVRGAAHMGAGPRSLLIVLFRMIPRFSPTRGARECATPTTPGGTREHQQSRPATVKPDPYNLQSRESPHREPPRPKHSPCLRCNDTPQPRTGSTTDLEPELDRSRCGAWWVRASGVVVVGVAHGRAGPLRGGGLVFVGMTGFFGERGVWWSGSHVR